MTETILAPYGKTFDPSPFFGQPIHSIEVVDDALMIGIGGSSIKLRDDGQSCCESRYMHTDDDLPYYKGAKLVGLELRDGPETDDDCDVKECQFLLVQTDRGTITIANYNEHNGYYGGFDVVGTIVAT